MKTIQIKEKSIKSLCKIIKYREIHYWNLYNPVTKELLTSSSLKKKGEFYFKDRPDSWDEYGVLDLGTDFDHCSIWLNRIKKWFDDGFVLCTLNKNESDRLYCDLYNVGFSFDEKFNIDPL